MSAKARKSPLKILPCAVFLAAAAALGSEVGDSYEKVLAEKGAPKSQMQAGAVRILSYSDETIKLRDDVVVSIKAVAVAPPQSVPPPQPGTPPNAAGQPATPAGTIASLKKQMKDAMAQVALIVNQPVATVPLTPELRAA